MKVLFIDESGDHNLTIIDPQYPLFVLGGVIMDQSYAEGELAEKVRAFKLELFGRDDIILHTADMARNRNGYERLKDRSFRERFYMKLNNLMRNAKYKVVACVIQKKEHIANYGVAAIDPYLMSLYVLVERFCFEIGNAENSGVIVAERRDPILDRELELAWLNLKIKGTRYVQANKIDRTITGLNLRPKSADIAGLQLADLVVSPIGRHILRRSEKEDFRIIKEKFRRDRRGRHKGYGLVVLPK